MGGLLDSLGACDATATVEGGKRYEADGKEER